MKHFFKVLSFIFLTLTLITSCKVRYGAHFQRIDANSYPHEVKSGLSNSPDADDLLVSTDKDRFIPVETSRLPGPITSIAPDKANPLSLTQKINKSINKYTPPGKSLDVTKEPEVFISNFKNLKKSDRRKIKREIRKLVKAELKSVKDLNEIKPSDASPLATDNNVLLIILAILLPPLAVGLHEGALNNTFWLNILLTLLFYIPGMVHALIVVTR